MQLQGRSVIVCLPGFMSVAFVSYHAMALKSLTTSVRQRSAQTGPA